MKNDMEAVCVSRTAFRLKREDIVTDGGWENGN